MEKNTNIKRQSSGNKKFLGFISLAFFVFFIILISGTASSQLTSLRTGCCLQDKDGGICQDLSMSSNNLCRNNLIPTLCDAIDECNLGCCYYAEAGTCSLNSPKGKCQANGGNWSTGALCNIIQCELGCCVLGNQASITTTRECTLISRELGFQKNWQPVDADGTCDSKTNLDSEGACVSDTGDFSGEKTCKFGLKSLCSSGEFYPGYLCTAEQLNTICRPSRNTTCPTDKDQVYYMDTCGNIANIYDASKYNDKRYWEKPVSKENSCSPASKNCGNCDYMQGSRCYPYRKNIDEKPTYGNNVCRDLNCETAQGLKKHGEAWCIADYLNVTSPGIAPVGSRWYVGKCIEGKVTITPCADFNNEICVERNLVRDASSITEARCEVNQWRNCIAANLNTTYDAVKQECEKYNDSCIMFLNISGNEIYKNHVGFYETESVDHFLHEDGGSGMCSYDIEHYKYPRGRIPGIADNINSVIPFCVPKYTPGLVFWDTSSAPAIPGVSPNTGTGRTTQQTQTQTTPDYGGSLNETTEICSLGSFSCVSQRYQKGRACLTNYVHYSNTECKDMNPAFVQGLVERCSSLGPCGLKVNIVGELGNNTVLNFQQIYTDSDGDSSAAYVPAGSSLNPDYIDNVKNRADIIAAGTLTPQNYFAINLITLPSITGNWMTTRVGEFFGRFAGETLLRQDGATAAAIEHAIGENINHIWVSLAVCGTTGAITLGLSCLWTVYEIFETFYRMIFDYEVYDHWTTTYECVPWSPPKTGNCDLCNNDVRACSEYKCRSIGQNCKYFTDGGEPGYCAAVRDVWSAQITPWEDALSEGYSYYDVSSTSFKIKSNSTEDGMISAYSSLEFGITTDKKASCKIDYKPTANYDAMAFDMAISNLPECAGLSAPICSENRGIYHTIALSPYISKGANATNANLGYSTSTLPLVKGENTYYIRCKSFSGAISDAEFAVRMNVADGEDYTAPTIKRFVPESGSYLAFGVNSSLVTLYVDEPSECRYSQDIDSVFEDMRGTMRCQKNPQVAVLGQWACTAVLSNLASEENRFFFQCMDKPDAEEGETRNINRLSKIYSLKVCPTGLNITRISPLKTTIIGKTSQPIILEAETSGCIEGGKSTCYFSVAGSELRFMNTDSNIHSQPLTGLSSGNYTIPVRCEDNTGNIAYAEASVNMLIDEEAPSVIRAYFKGNKIAIFTNELSVCKYSNNLTAGCDFDFNSKNVSQMEAAGNYHLTTWSNFNNYYIRCSDVYNNTNPGCGIVLSTY